MEGFCKLYYTSSYIPITAYSNVGERICAFSSFTGEIDINQVFIQQFLKTLQTTNEIDVVTTESFGYYGIVKLKSNETILVVGPVFNTVIGNELIRKFIRECEIDSIYHNEVTNFLISIPRISYHQISNVLSFIYFCIHNEMHPSSSFPKEVEETIKDKIDKDFTNKTYESKETQTFHNTYSYERHLLKLISEGNPNMVKALLTENASRIPLTEGVLAFSPLRQAQNIFIGWTTMVGKVAAIEGGLDVEQTYSLIDVYIQECERLQSIESISKLTYNMVMDFACRVESHKIPTDASPLTISIIQFIKNHVNEAIRIDDVASYIGRSRSYLVDVFKKELGFNMGEYILHCKLNEAKSLLIYSNKSMSEISNYLCFSSQSYFISVFKKTYGITPKQFQAKHKPV
jgi:AraC-like DNA-binding protein